jgi:hypothetical protein
LSLGWGFDDQTWMPRDASDGLRFQRLLEERNRLAGEFLAHECFEVVTTHRGDMQRRSKRGRLVAVTTVIFDEVEKLLRVLADGGQEGLVGISKPSFGARVARAAQFRTTFRKLVEGGVPVEVVHGALCGPSRCSMVKVK